MSAVPIFNAVYNAGLDPALPGQYLPTLVVQTTKGRELAVLDPQPRFDEASSVVMSWLEIHPLALGNHEVMSVGFLTAWDRMEVVERRTSGEKSYSGSINWADASVNWNA
jgi:hypothetical protein